MNFLPQNLRGFVRRVLGLPKTPLEQQTRPPVGIVTRGITPELYEIVQDSSGVLRYNNLIGGTSDIFGMAEEDLADAAFVYYNPLTGKWANQDIDASPMKMNNPRGIVNFAGGIKAGSSGLISRSGVVYKFPGILPGPVYASSVPGGYTQTKPTLTLNGPQVAIALMGYGVEGGGIAIEPGQIIYQKRVGPLASLGTANISHHADMTSYTRRMAAYIPFNNTSLAQSYPASNYDADVFLRGMSGAGGTTTVDTTGNANALVGAAALALTNTRLAQSFQVTAGRLSGATVFHGPNNGTPGTLTLTATIQTDNAGSPSGTVLATCVYTPIPNANNTLTFTSAPILQAATPYWLVIQTTQVALLGSYWQIRYNTANPYPLGQLKSDTALVAGLLFAGVWTNVVNANTDLRITVSTSAIPLSDRIAQGFQVQAAVRLNSLRLMLAKVGAPSGNLAVEIAADNAGVPGNAIANGTSNTVAISGLNSVSALIDFTFANTPTLAANTPYWITLTTTATASNTDYVTVGADTTAPTYANGAAWRFGSGAWAAYTPASDLIFEMYSLTTIVSQWYTMGLFTNSVATGLEVIGAVVGNGAGGEVETLTTFRNRTSASIADLVIQVIIEPS